MLVCKSLPRVRASPAPELIQLPLSSLLCFCTHPNTTETSHTHLGHEARCETRAEDGAIRRGAEEPPER